MQSSYFSRRCLMIGGLFLTGSILAVRCPAQDPLTGFAVFGGKSVALNGPAKINTGLIGSNGDVSLGPSTECKGAEGGGQLKFSSTGGTTINGPVTFNGDVMLGVASKTNGPINSGGSINALGQSVFNGDITAAGNIIIGLSGGETGNVNAGGYFTQGAFNKMTGDVLANGGAVIGGTLNGNLTATQLQVPFGGQVNGKTKQGSGTVTPAKYTPVTVPPADEVKTGTEDQDGDGDADDPLKPGRYAALNVHANHKLYLTSGDYYFTSITLNQSSSIHLVNITPEKGLHVFVSGDLKEALWVTTFVNGKTFTDADASLAGKVVWEVLGKFDQTELGQGTDDWFGTIFAPKGPIIFGHNSTLTGTLISGGDIMADAFFTQTFVPASRFAVPAPIPAP